MFWKFAHNALVHPLMAFPWTPRWVERLHDWTAEKWIATDDRRGRP